MCQKSRYGNMNQQGQPAIAGWPRRKNADLALERINSIDQVDGTLGIHFLSRHIGLQTIGHELQKNPRYFIKRNVDQALRDTQRQCEQVLCTLQL